MRRMFLLPILVLSLAVSACSAPTKVTKMQDISFAGLPKKLALLTGTEYDPDIRLALAQYGFKVVKFSSVRKVERDTSATSRESFSQAATRFGLSVYPGRMFDYCLTSSGILLGRIAFELTDLASNETVLYVHAGGWTEACGARNELVWDKLATKLAENWR